MWISKLRHRAGMSRLILLVAASGCNNAAEPAETREIGVIRETVTREPQISLSPLGKTVTVRVVTYGGPCSRVYKTEVQISGLTATVVPYNIHGECVERSVHQIEHRVQIPFTAAGVAVIIVRGLDGSTRSATNVTGDTLVVRRELVIQ